MLNFETTIKEQQAMICEHEFDLDHLGKMEVLMAQGNGYLGLRSVTEEFYVGEKRNTFVAGTFNQADLTEVTELPNVPDVTQLNCICNGVRLDLSKGVVTDYERSLNLITGELKRTFIWQTKETGRVAFDFSRMVSMADCHLIVQKISVTPLDQTLTYQFQSGINGQVTNSGAQHFIEGEKRLYPEDVMHMVQQTTTSGIRFSVGTVHQGMLNGEPKALNMKIRMDRRKIYGDFHETIPQKACFELTKWSRITTSRDCDGPYDNENDLVEANIQKLQQAKTQPYKDLLKASHIVWDERLWSKVPISITSDQMMDQVVPVFAQYHLQIAMPMHDDRMGIAAKGLTGEGYKGHSFWDTEIFMFPYFLYTQPELAKQLLLYRYHTLEGAKAKAKANGFEGAMFPWESAWLDDGEVTPVWGAADVVTGKATKIWSGFIEQHITADIVYAIQQYYVATKDEAFMEQFGYEIIIETAKFWLSRLEYDATDGLYHINQVIGPDEYKEHIDDNAFTNYMVYYNLELAVMYGKAIQEKGLQKGHACFKHIQQLVKKCEGILEQIYLPKPDALGIIAQDKTYLQKPILDVSQYKAQSHVGGLFDDYSLDQVNGFQVSKQADVLMLLYLREQLFTNQIKQANWNYYEPKTLHDSSLSLSTHAILANDLGHYDRAYDLFQAASGIDLGPNLKSSDHGIHAAALGGLMQMLIHGFGGIRILNGQLRIEPRLPKAWQCLAFHLAWQQEVLKITVTPQVLKVVKTTRHQPVVEFMAFGTHYLLVDELVIDL